MPEQQAAVTQSETVTKVRRLIDVEIVIDPPSHLSWGNGDLNELARSYERWAKEFEAFVRDHRSQDPVSISIERRYQQQCSRCGAEWEEEFYEEDGLYHCANCGRPMEVTR